MIRTYDVCMTYSQGEEDVVDDGKKRKRRGEGGGGKGGGAVETVGESWEQATEAILEQGGPEGIPKLTKEMAAELSANLEAHNPPKQRLRSSTRTSHPPVTFPVTSKFL